MQRITKTVDMYDIATFMASPWAEEKPSEYSQSSSALSLPSIARRATEGRPLSSTG